MTTEAPKKPERSLSWLTLWLAFIIFLGLVGWIRMIVTSIGRGKFWEVFGLIFPMLLFLGWFLWLMQRIMRSRDLYRKRLETGGGKLKLKDSLVFALTWSREIFTNIPPDRRPLIYNAYLLILVVVVVLIIRGLSFGNILFILLVILAAINLLVWVVGSERQEKDRMEVELAMARKMQMSLMPAADFIQSGLEISGYCIPSAQVGGDHFDYLHFGHNPERVYVTVVDVSGKGMAAAVTAIYASGAISSEVAHQDKLETAMENLNTAICNRKSREQFISVLLAEIDIPRRRLAFINAGQSRPLLLRNGAISVLRGEGIPFPLGVREHGDYRHAGLDLAAGDYLLFHTDGVTDAVNETNEMFGDVRLHALFQETCLARPSAQVLVGAMKARLDAFSASAYQLDDITLVALRVTG